MVVDAPVALRCKRVKGPEQISESLRDYNNAETISGFDTRNSSSIKCCVFKCNSVSSL